MRAGTKQWLEIAAEDYDVSLLLFKRASHPQAIYAMCQAVEKVLKAAQIEIANQPPQKTHQLEKIARESGLDFSDEQYQILKELSKHYRRVRYPDIQRIRYNTKAKAQQIIDQGREVYQWVLTKLKNH